MSAPMFKRAFGNTRQVAMPLVSLVTGLLRLPGQVAINCIRLILLYAVGYLFYAGFSFVDEGKEDLGEAQLVQSVESSFDSLLSSSMDRAVRHGTASARLGSQREYDPLSSLAPRSEYDPLAMGRDERESSFLASPESSAYNSALASSYSASSLASSVNPASSSMLASEGSSSLTGLESMLGVDLSEGDAFDWAGKDKSFDGEQAYGDRRAYAGSHAYGGARAYGDSRGSIDYDGSQAYEGKQAFGNEQAYAGSYDYDGSQAYEGNDGSQAYSDAAKSIYPTAESIFGPSNEYGVDNYDKVMEVSDLEALFNNEDLPDSFKYRHPRAWKRDFIAKRMDHRFKDSSEKALLYWSLQHTQSIKGPPDDVNNIGAKWELFLKDNPKVARQSRSYDVDTSHNLVFEFFPNFIEEAYLPLWALEQEGYAITDAKKKLTKTLTKAQEEQQGLIEGMAALAQSYSDDDITELCTVPKKPVNKPANKQLAQSSASLQDDFEQELLASISTGLNKTEDVPSEHREGLSKADLADVYAHAAPKASSSFPTKPSFHVHRGNNDALGSNDILEEEEEEEVDEQFDEQIDMFNGELLGKDNGDLACKSNKVNSLHVSSKEPLDAPNGLSMIKSLSVVSPSQAANAQAGLNKAGVGAHGFERRGEIGSVSEPQSRAIHTSAAASQAPSTATSSTFAQPYALESYSLVAVPFMPLVSKEDGRASLSALAASVSSSYSLPSSYSSYSDEGSIGLTKLYGLKGVGAYEGNKDMEAHRASLNNLPSCLDLKQSGISFKDIYYDLKDSQQRLKIPGSYSRIATLWNHKASHIPQSWNKTTQDATVFAQEPRNKDGALSAQAASAQATALQANKAFEGAANKMSNRAYYQSPNKPSNMPFDSRSAYQLSDSRSATYLASNKARDSAFDKASYDERGAYDDEGGAYETAAKSSSNATSIASSSASLQQSAQQTGLISHAHGQHDLLQESGGVDKALSKRFLEQDGSFSLRSLEQQRSSSLSSSSSLASSSALSALSALPKSQGIEQGFKEVNAAYEAGSAYEGSGGHDGHAAHDGHEAQEGAFIDAFSNVNTIERRSRFARREQSKSKDFVLNKAKDFVLDAEAEAHQASSKAINIGNKVSNTAINAGKKVFNKGFLNENRDAKALFSESSYDQSFFAKALFSDGENASANNRASSQVLANEMVKAKGNESLSPNINANAKEGSNVNGDFDAANRPSSAGNRGNVAAYVGDKGYVTAYDDNKGNDTASQAGFLADDALVSSTTTTTSSSSSTAVYSSPSFAQGLLSKSLSSKGSLAPLPLTPQDSEDYFALLKESYAHKYRSLNSSLKTSLTKALSAYQVSFAHKIPLNKDTSFNFVKSLMAFKGMNDLQESDAWERAPYLRSELFSKVLTRPYFYSLALIKTNSLNTLQELSYKEQDQSYAVPQGLVKQGRQSYETGLVNCEPREASNEHGKDSSYHREPYYGDMGKDYSAYGNESSLQLIGAYESKDELTVDLTDDGKTLYDKSHLLASDKDALSYASDDVATNTLDDWGQNAGNGVGNVADNIVCNYEDNSSSLNYEGNSGSRNYEGGKGNSLTDAGNYEVKGSSLNDAGISSLNYDGKGGSLHYALNGSALSTDGGSGEALISADHFENDLLSSIALKASSSFKQDRSKVDAYAVLFGKTPDQMDTSSLHAIAKNMAKANKAKVEENKRLLAQDKAAHTQDKAAYFAKGLSYDEALDRAVDGKGAAVASSASGRSSYLDLPVPPVPPNKVFPIKDEHKYLFAPNYSRMIMTHIQAQEEVKHKKRQALLSGRDLDPTYKMGAYEYYNLQRPQDPKKSNKLTNTSLGLTAYSKPLSDDHLRYRPFEYYRSDGDEYDRSEAFGDREDELMLAAKGKATKGLGGKGYKVSDRGYDGMSAYQPYSFKAQALNSFSAQALIPWKLESFESVPVPSLELALAMAWDEGNGALARDDWNKGKEHLAVEGYHSLAHDHNANVKDLAMGGVKGAVGGYSYPVQASNNSAVLLDQSSLLASREPHAALSLNSKEAEALSGNYDANAAKLNYGVSAEALGRTIAVFKAHEGAYWGGCYGDGYGADGLSLVADEGLYSVAIDGALEGGADEVAIEGGAVYGRDGHFSSSTMLSKAYEQVFTEVRALSKLRQGLIVERLLSLMAPYADDLLVDMVKLNDMLTSEYSSELIAMLPLDRPNGYYDRALLRAKLLELYQSVYSPNIINGLTYQGKLAPFVLKAMSAYEQQVFAYKQAQVYWQIVLNTPLTLYTFFKTGKKGMMGVEDFKLTAALRYARGKAWEADAQISQRERAWDKGLGREEVALRESEAYKAGKSMAHSSEASYASYELYALEDVRGKEDRWGGFYEDDAEVDTDYDGILVSSAHAHEDVAERASVQALLDVLALCKHTVPPHKPSLIAKGQRVALALAYCSGDDLHCIVKADSQRQLELANSAWDDVHHGRHAFGLFEPLRVLSDDEYGMQAALVVDLACYQGELSTEQGLVLIAKRPREGMMALELKLLRDGFFMPELSDSKSLRSYRFKHNILLASVANEDSKQAHLLGNWIDNYPTADEQTIETLLLSDAEEILAPYIKGDY